MAWSYQPQHIREFTVTMSGIQRIYESEGLEMSISTKIRHFFFRELVLRAPEELEALLWICFTLMYVLLIFMEKIFFRKIFRRFFLIEKILLCFCEIFNI